VIRQAVDFLQSDHVSIVVDDSVKKKKVSSGARLRAQMRAMLCRHSLSHQGRYPVLDLQKVRVGKKFATHEALREHLQGRSWQTAEAIIRKQGAAGLRDRSQSVLHSRSR
jgi:hypothetical protein